MHFINLPNLAFLALSYFALDVVADSGYSRSCHDIGWYHSIRGEYSIIATCAYENGTFNVEDSINLDKCFTNAGGNLVGQANGGFSGSCNNIYLSGTILHATCGNGAGGYNVVSINTDDYIGNNNGVMTCFGLYGD